MDPKSKIKPMRLQNIQALRGVAALMVFFAHIVGAEADYGGGEQVLPYFLHMGQTGVDLFFLISGFIMVYVTMNIDAPETNISPQANQPLNGKSRVKTSAEFFLRRAARIYPLYWIMTLSLIILYAGKKLIFGEDSLIPNYLASFLLLPDKELPILPVGWTLVYEMYFYTIFSVCLLFHRKYLPILLSVWAVIIAVGWFTGLREVNSWFAVMFSPLNFEFLAGALIAYLSLKEIKSNPIALALIAMIALFVLLILLAHNLYPKALANHGYRAALMTAPFGLLLFACVNLEWGATNQQKNQTRLQAPQWLITIGDASYALYLVHIPVFLVVGKMLSLNATTGITDNIILIIIYITTGIVAALITHFYIERPINKWVKKLLTK